MQALKALVITMALLIVAGLALVAYGILARVTTPAARPFEEIVLDLPAGCVIAEARPETAANRLILRTEGPAERGCQQVLVVDLESGAVLGRIRAEP